MGISVSFLDNIVLGLHVALSPSALLACLIGVTFGTLVGVLPGIGAVAGIALLLPLTFYQQPADALIMLAGIYYGSMYGGSVASILLNLPGESSSAVTCIDGHPMAKQGRGGVALFMTAIASFLGACVSIVLMAAFAPAIASIALAFGPADYFAMMVLGLMAAASISGDAPVKGLVMVVVGLMVGLIGADVQTGVFRYTFGYMELVDGVGIIVVAMGLFGISEVLLNIGQKNQKALITKEDLKWKKLLPDRDDWRRSWMPITRGSAVGAILGVLPGTGATVAGFVSYAVEKRVSREPERFGNGAIEGVSGPESANSGAAQASFIPTMTLGIPGNSVMALMIGALMIHGIAPGPNVVVQHPELFWGLVMSFWIGNLLLLVLNIPMIGIWVRMLSIPPRILYPAIIFFVCIGVYAVNGRVMDVYLVLIFGVVGYFLRLFGYPVAPLLLGYVLGPMLEENLRRALLMSRGDLSVFVTEPVSAVLLLTSALFFLAALWSAYKKRGVRVA